MHVKDEEGKPLDDERLRDVVMSFVIAGRDTTANCLSWVFYELHMNPACMAKYVPCPAPPCHALGNDSSCNGGW